jgi:ADP-heptose:LPS heptosyltransferase
MNTQQYTNQQPTAMTDTRKQPFVHLAYRKIMIDHLPLRELARSVKAAAVVLGAPVRVFFSGTARDRQGTLLDLTHGWYELKVEQHARQRYFPLLDPGETRVIRPEQDIWDHLVLLQPASEEEQA